MDSEAYYYIARSVLMLWSIWAGFAIYYTNKLFRKDLKYLLEPDVNLFSSNNSSSRYDPVNISKWEIYVGSIILIPIRIILSICIVVPGYLIMRVLSLVFCGNDDYNIK